LVVFSAGGAARAITVEAARAGAASITIVNRDAARGSELVALLTDRTATRADLVVWDGPYRIPEGTDVVVNATSIGLAPDLDARLELEVDSLTSDMVVADVIPNPPSTWLIRDTQARGCTVLDGLGMLVNQGAIGIRRRQLGHRRSARTEVASLCSGDVGQIRVRRERSRQGTEGAQAAQLIAGPPRQCLRWFDRIHHERSLSQSGELPRASVGGGDGA